jgi:hypothetical protein
MALCAGRLLDQVPWRRSGHPMRHPANSKTSISSLTPSHHGDADAARSSSAEAPTNLILPVRRTQLSGERKKPAQLTSRRIAV